MGWAATKPGRWASELAVQRVRETLADEDATPTAERVIEAISDANGDIFRAAIANPGQAGMGTTVTVIAVIEDPMAGRGEPNIDANDPVGPDRVTPIVPRETTRGPSTCQRRRLAHLPAAPRSASASHHRPQLRPRTRFERLHHR